MAITNTKLYESLDKLREDLKIKSAGAALNQKPDMDSEALLKDLYGDIMNPEEYDVTQDPAYSGLKKAAYRESDRTMRDVLAQQNTKSNGFTNSAAVTAASQARDYTMSQFDDKLADMEDRALSKKQAKISAKMQLLSAIEGMEATKRQNYLDDLDRIEKAAAEEKQIAESEALNIIKMGGVPSDELLQKTGWSAEYIKAVKQNTYDSMDTAEMQRYLNSKGANLTVDGAWGPATEAAYVKIFGKPSGRQSYTGSTGSNYNYQPKSPQNPQPAQTAPSSSFGKDAPNFAQMKQDIKTMSAAEAKKYAKDAYNAGYIDGADYSKLIVLIDTKNK